MMKNWYFLFLSLSFPLSADSGDSFDNILEPPVEPSTITPAFFQIDGRGDWIASSKIQDPLTRGQTLGYAEVDGRAGYAFPCGCSMISLAAGYQRTWVNLSPDYPFDRFKRTKFQNAYATLGGKLFDGNWTFQGEVQINADLDLGGDKSMLYFYGGWATYSNWPCFSTSIGFIARSGIRQDKFWPVLGVEWMISDQWEIHAVYPINIAVIYRPADDFYLSLATRFINSRHRLERDEVVPSGIFQYRNIGEELGITYTIGQFFSINAHAGWMFSGELEIENSRGSSILNLESNSAFYAGGSFLIRF